MEYFKHVLLSRHQKILGRAAPEKGWRLSTAENKYPAVPPAQLSVGLYSPFISIFHHKVWSLLKMQIKYVSFAALAATASAQSLTKALSQQPSLSNLTTYLGLFPSLVTQLESLKNVTLLAPNNQAFEALLNSTPSLASNPGLLESVLTYHVLNGSYANFSSSAAFIHTALMNTTYANVTGGQVVEAIGTSNGTTFYSGKLQSVPMSECALRS
jgi:hypothetical protein